MGKVIRLRDDTFRRLQALSEPFITPDTAINVLLDELDKLRAEKGNSKVTEPEWKNSELRAWYATYRYY